MRAFTAAVGLLAVMAVPLACDHGSEGGALATVDGQKIERADVDSLIALYRRRSEAEGEGEGEKRETVSHAQELATLQVLVQRAVIEQEAKRLGIHLGRDEVEKRATALAGRESEAKDREGAENEAELEEQFRDTARAQLMSEALHRRVTRNVHVSDAKVLAYYRSHRLLYTGGGTQGRPSQAVKQSIRRGLTAIERDQAMARWLKRVRRQAEPDITYAKGWMPRN
jgi:SurA N-terminal domain